MKTTDEQMRVLSEFRRYTGHFRCTNAQAKELADALDALMTEVVELRAKVLR